KVSENKETADPSEKVETQKDTEIAGEKAENAQVVQKEAKLEMTSEAEAEVTPEVKPSEKTDVVATLPRAELISESETQEVLEAVELPDLPSVPGEGVGENTGGNAGESAENVTDSSDSLMELTPPSLDSLTDTGEGGGVAETVESTPKLPETASKLRGKRRRVRQNYHRRRKSYRKLHRNYRR
ncbi:MAG: hypothetical protein Q4C70_14040, partial [Planctomycetia bacterium]|nr:hypothetical protein [Planctomycetia bacterium]